MYCYMNLLIDISHIQNPLKLCEYILSIIFRLLELYAAGALNRMLLPYDHDTTPSPHNESHGIGMAKLKYNFFS